MHWQLPSNAAPVATQGLWVARYFASVLNAFCSSSSSPASILHIVLMLIFFQKALHQKKIDWFWFTVMIVNEWILFDKTFRDSPPHSGHLDWNKFPSTIDALPGISGVSKMCLHQLNSNLESKLNKLWKIFKLKNKMFSYCFSKFLQFKLYIAHQTSEFESSWCWRIFWHPWGSWGHLNSRDTR